MRNTHRILLPSFLASVLVLATTDSRADAGLDAAMRDVGFRSALARFTEFDQAAAAVGFEAVRERGATDPAGLHAQYHLALTRFAQTRFKTAAREAALLDEWMRRYRADVPHVRVRRLLESLSTGDSETLRAVILAQSPVRNYATEVPEHPELGVYEALRILGMLDRLAHFQPTPVYDAARERLSQPLTANADDTVGTLRERIRVNAGGMEPVDDATWGATVLTLALYAPVLSVEPEVMAEVLGQAACAHQLRQIGIAFHLYLLDHNALFPPVLVTRGTPQEQEKDWVVLLMPYLGFEPEIVPTGSWSGNPDRLVVNPSLFLCPGRTSHPWVTFRTRGGEYGYNTYLEPRGTEKTPVGYADIIPNSQVLVAETSGNNRFNTPAAFVTPHRGRGNVLYADGTVRMQNRDWAVNHGWYVRPGPDNPWNTIER